MVTSYNTGSPSASVKLTAIRSGHGGLAHESLSWRLVPVEPEGASNKNLYQSDEPQAELTVIPGKYRIFAIHKQQEIDYGEEDLEKNTARDLVYILNDDDLFDSETQYSAETDPHSEYERRKADRESEYPLGDMITPIKDPNRKSEMGSSLAAHPLLSEQAQFDGMPPEVNPDPTENEEAANKAELQLQNELQHQNAAQASPSSSPSPFG
jgi:hypothetical protein